MFVSKKELNNLIKLVENHERRLDAHNDRFHRQDEEIGAIRFEIGRTDSTDPRFNRDVHTRPLTIKERVDAIFKVVGLEVKITEPQPGEVAVTKVVKTKTPAAKKPAARKK